MPSEAKGKTKNKLAIKKRKYPDADIERAAAVVAAVDHAERGGDRSGV